tara:strand:+ start:14557 stop:14721 length:165 start_codon:yes stop_codon:yes gene_type:complete
LYECSPIAFLTEQKNVKATDVSQRIMDLQPSELHQIVAIFCGSVQVVEKVDVFM